MYNRNTINKKLRKNGNIGIVILLICVAPLIMANSILILSNTKIEQNRLLDSIQDNYDTESIRNIATRELIDTVIDNNGNAFITGFYTGNNMESSLSEKLELYGFKDIMVTNFKCEIVNNSGIITVDVVIDAYETLHITVGNLEGAIIEELSLESKIDLILNVKAEDIVVKTEVIETEI